jgi:hypothetical protein
MVSGVQCREQKVQESNVCCLKLLVYYDVSMKTMIAGRLCLPQTIDEESDEDEFIIEYVTDSEEDVANGSDEEW